MTESQAPQQSYQTKAFKLLLREEIMIQFIMHHFSVNRRSPQDFGSWGSLRKALNYVHLILPFGRYRILYQCFSITSAAEVYQQARYIIYGHTSGVNNSMDDIIIWDSTEEEHSCRLLVALDTPRASNLKLKRANFMLGITELIFIEDTIYTVGVKLERVKIETTEITPCPQSKKEVQWFFWNGKFSRQIHT